jgi:hypothetical protein
MGQDVGQDLLRERATRFPKETWSGRRDSNPQPSAWEADALPLRHTRLKGEKKIVKDTIRVNPR